MMRCMACDLGPENIRVNAVCPGTIDTPATDLHAKKLGWTKETLTQETVKNHFIKRLGTTLDVAHAVLFLASDESTFITGTSLTVVRISLVQILCFKNIVVGWRLQCSLK